MHATYELTHENRAAGEEVNRMREVLDHWRGLNQGKHDERRRLPRNEYVAQAIVSVDPQSGPVRQLTFEGWTRDLSSTGVSLLLPRHLKPRRSIAVGQDAGGEVDLYEVLQTGDEVLVGLSKTNRVDLWMHAVIRRLRRVQDFVLDCGVQFTGRHT